MIVTEVFSCFLNHLFYFWAFCVVFLPYIYVSIFIPCCIFTHYNVLLPQTQVFYVVLSQKAYLAYKLFQAIWGSGELQYCQILSQP